MLTHTLKDIVNSLGTPNIGVVGDVMLDEWFHGEKYRSTMEFGTPMDICDVTREEVSAGGAANVANHLASLGANAYLFGVVGRDHYGRALQASCREKRVHTRLLEDSTRRTTVKTRVLYNDSYTRFDRESREPLLRGVRRRFLKLLKHHAPSIDYWIISDYLKGVISPKVVATLCELGEVLVDPKGDEPLKYVQCNVIKPNVAEVSSLDTWADVAPLIVTLGGKGVQVWIDNQRITIPGWPVKCVDAVGAGDATVAGIAMGLCSSLVKSLPTPLRVVTAASLGNAVGACSVTMQGTHQGVTRTNVLELLDTLEEVS
jgi:D-beta-D-heptose 7-phosphate kinase/D-beta-D-heptose 1-phosphate adenosyltransferase